MLHLRSVAPAALTDAVLDALTGDPAVTSVTILRGASVKPVGDVIEADVAREAANDVVQRLLDLGVQTKGTITLEPVTTWMSRAAFEADALAPGESDDSVVWPEVTQRAYEDSRLTWTYLSFMVLATVLAAIAIITDSQILVIGAMVLGPEFGAIAALGLALARAWTASTSRTRFGAASTGPRWSSSRPTTTTPTSSVPSKPAPPATC